MLCCLHHADVVHVGGGVHDRVALQQRVEALAVAGGEVVALRPDRHAADAAVLQHVGGRGEEVGVELGVHVGEQLGHRVGAAILDPGARHREMEIHGGHDEGRGLRGVAEVEDAEGAVAEGAAVVEELAHVFRVLDAAEDQQVEAAALHHRVEARAVEQDGLTAQGVFLRLDPIRGGPKRPER